MSEGDRWDRRLENWALWVVSGGASAAVSSAYGFIGAGAGGSGSGVPPLVGEAIDTDALVGQLEKSLKQAVVAWYVWTGNIEERARDLGVHRDTLTDRVKRAKLRLDELYYAKAKAKGANRLPQNMI